MVNRVTNSFKGTKYVASKMMVYLHVSGAEDEWQNEKYYIQDHRSGKWLF